MPRNLRRLGVVGLLLAAVGGVPAGCSSDPRQGYSFETTFDHGITSVSVPMFDNQTFARGAEGELAEALAHEIRQQTPWRIVQNDTANATLSGTITSAEMAKLSTARDSGLVESLGYVLTVDFTFRDNRSGKTIVERRSFRAADAFVPTRGTTGPVNERIEVAQAGTAQALARRIVAELRVGW
jgi:hypothetical protein